MQLLFRPQLQLHEYAGGRAISSEQMTYFEGSPAGCLLHEVHDSYQR